MSKISKEYILQKTFEIITNEGIDKITLSRLAKELGCSKSSIYYYFGSKEELLNDLFDKTLKDIEYQYDDSISPEGNISKIIDISFDNILSYKFFKMYAHSDFLTDETHEKLKLFEKQKQQEVSKIYEHLNLNGKISLKNFNSILFGTIMHFSFQTLHENEKNIDENEKEDLKKQILKLIK